MSPTTKSQKPLFSFRVLLFLIIAIALISSGFAFAAEDPQGGEVIYYIDNSGVNLNSPETIPAPLDTDVSFILLQKTFGNFVQDIRENFWDIPATGDANQLTVLSTLVTILTWITLFVGTILIGYTSFIGVVNTAHDGEVLGKQWSSIWIPLRAAVGIGMISPIQSLGGLALVQTLILAVAMMGASVANIVWDASIKLIATKPVVQNKPDPSIYYLGESILLSQVCLIHKSEHGLIQNTLERDDLSTGTFAQSGTSHNQVVRYYAGKEVDDSGSTVDSGGCGTLDATIDITNIGNNSVLKVQKKIYNRFDAAIYRLWDDIRPITEKIVNSDELDDFEVLSDTDYDDYHDALLRYYNTIAGFGDSTLIYHTEVSSDLIASSDSMTNDFIDQTSSGGWAMAGSYYWTLVRWAEAFTGPIQSLTELEFSPPSETDSNVTSHFDSFRHQYARILNVLDDEMYNILNTPRAIEIFGTVARRDVSNYDREEIAGLITSVTKNLQKSNTGIVTGADQGRDVDPLLAMRDIGTGIVTQIARFMTKSKEEQKSQVQGTIDQLTYKVAGLNYSGPSAKAANKQSSTMKSTMTSVIIFSFISLGILLAYVLPSLPYILWIGGVLAYLVFVVEAIIAAPIWAIMHAHPEGHSTAGKGGQGYWMLAALLARPFLMVLGLIAAMVLFRVIAWFVNYTILDTVIVMHQDNTNAIAALGLVIIYTSLMISLCYKCFGLIYEIPRWFLNWVGSSDYHGDSGEQKIMSTAGGAASQAGSSAQRGAMMGDKPDPELPPTKNGNSKLLSS